MKRLLQVTFLAISLTLMACPYESDVPISTYDEAVKTDKKLLGEWVSFNEDGSKQELSISKLKKGVLLILHKTFGKNNKFEAGNKYRIFGYKAGESTIFNVESKDGKYRYCKYDWTSKNEIYVQFINASFMSNNFKEDTVTTKNLKSFFVNNINNEELYDKKVEFYRKYSPEYEKVRLFMQKSGF